MTDDQIKHMVDRFLGWKLPDSFNPDGGVSFKRLENRHHHPEASPFYPMPTGTNLLDATQATEMVRHMVEGLPLPSSSAATEDDCPGHVASTNDPRICGRCGIHIDSLRPDTE